MMPSRKSRTQLSLLCVLLSFASLWNSGCCLDFGVKINHNEFPLKNIPIFSLLPEQLNETTADVANSQTLSHLVKPAFSVSNIEVENKGTPNNATPPPEKKEDTTFNPETILFGAEDVMSSAVPIEIDPKKLIPMDEAEQLSGHQKPEIVPLNVTSILPPSESIAPLPPHNLSENPEAIDAVSRKLFDREDVQPPVNT